MELNSVLTSRLWPLLFPQHEEKSNIMKPKLPKINNPKKEIKLKSPKTGLGIMLPKHPKLSFGSKKLKGY